MFILYNEIQDKCKSVKRFQGLSRIWLVFFYEADILHTQISIFESGSEIMGTRIGVLSDTHLYRVSAELKEIYSKYLLGTDLVLHAGDIVALEVVEFLKNENFHGVSGNMDSLEVKAVLPSKKIVKVGKFRIGLIHGWGSSDGLEKRVMDEFTDVDIIVYGHSHKAFNRKKEGVLLFNPGTATGPSFKGGNSIGILDLNDKISSKIISL